MRFILVLSFLIFATVAASPAYAVRDDDEQKFSRRELDSWQKSMPRYTKQYNDILVELYKSPELTEHKLSLLRSYYSRSKQYSPFSKAILDKMTTHAAMLETASDIGVINDELRSYKGLRDAHLMNFDVLSFALLMSQIDVRFGDELSYRRIRNNLIEVFYNEKMGLKPETAHYITSYGEETYILEQISDKINHSELYEVNNRYYNVHDIVTKEGKSAQIFMDVTVPIRNVLYKQAIQKRESSTNIRIH